MVYIYRCKQRSFGQSRALFKRVFFCEKQRRGLVPKLQNKFFKEEHLRRFHSSNELYEFLWGVYGRIFECLSDCEGECVKE